ncbi:MAG: hypothetical protein KF893_26445 [Caldilineaceae bacterium]|nr:hypothetical protein [Caldilineaceae bacterium]
MSENNIPTMFGGQGGLNMGSGFLIGAGASGEIQWIFNIVTGELRYAVNAAGGMRAGTPQNTVAVYFGATFVTGTERFENLQGASKFTAIDAGTASLKGGLTGTASRAYQYDDLNEDFRFNLSPYSEPLTQPVHDAKYNRTVDTLSVDIVAGFNITPIPVDGGVTHGVSSTNLTDGGVNLYTPIRAFMRIFGR